MEFHFNAELAQKYGVDGAIFLHCMAFWVAKNRANGRHFHEGRYWTYNTLEALAKMFPFWTRRQIERIVGKLKDDGALLVGDFNEDKTDRTRWYALRTASWRPMGRPCLPFHGMVKCISPNRDSHFTKRGNVIRKQLVTSYIPL